MIPRHWQVASEVDAMLLKDNFDFVLPYITDAEQLAAKKPSDWKFIERYGEEMKTVNSTRPSDSKSLTVTSRSESESPIDFQVSRANFKSLLFTFTDSTFSLAVCGIGL